MKTINALVVLTVISLAALAPASNALAAPTVHSGTVCHNYNASEVRDIDYFTDGAVSGVASWRQVICPLAVTHTAGQTVGAVWVDFNTSTPMTCTLYSYSERDTFLGSKTVTTGSGTTSRETFIGYVPASSLSNHAVSCSLPPSYSGKIVAITAYF